MGWRRNTRVIRLECVCGLRIQFEFTRFKRMKTIKPHFIFFALLVTTTQLEARATRYWSYGELHAASDAVVIAKPLSNTDTKDIFDVAPSSYIGVNTELQVVEIYKGNIGPKKFTVLHFRDKPSVNLFGLPTVYDGMLVIKFRLDGPGYLLFLKKRTDGRYEPVTGQEDAILSVIQEK